MIVGDLAAWGNEAHVYSKALNRGMAFLTEQNLADLTPGRYDIDGDYMFALVMESVTEHPELRKPEVHERYIDIQYLVAGEGEMIGVCRRSSDYVPSEDYLCSRDIAFFQEVKDESFVLLRPGMFAVFFPDDIHRPLCAVSDRGCPVKKVVIKVDKSMV